MAHNVWETIVLADGPVTFTQRFTVAARDEAHAKTVAEGLMVAEIERRHGAATADQCDVFVANVAPEDALR